MPSITGEVPRHARGLAREILSDTPLLVVQGARCVGKSTFLHQVLSPDDAVFVTLDDPISRQFAEEDPVPFLRQAPGKTLVVEEAQRVPSLSLPLKLVIDQNRVPGAFAVTSSADLLRLKGTEDSLAGRASSITLRPLSQGEIEQRADPEDFITWVANGCTGNLDCASNIRERVTAGGYPELLARSTDRGRNHWFTEYLQRILRSDVPEVAGHSSHLTQSFEPLIRLLAIQGGIDLVVARLANQLGVSEPTLRVCLGTLETLFLTEKLRPWGWGYGNRVIRRPTLTLVDTGLAGSLTGQASDFTAFGTQLKAFVAGELHKQQVWSETSFRLHHYCQRNNEIDIVVEIRGGSVILLRVVPTSHVRHESWASLQRIAERFGSRVQASIILYTGEIGFCADKEHSIYVLPVGLLWEHKRV